VNHGKRIFEGTKIAMPTLKSWLLAARLRTLPLSVSGILMGTGMAVRNQSFDLTIFILALITTLGFQILSNFANDYGDGVKGTDNEERIGPARALQSGLLSANALKKGMWFMALFTLIVAVFLIYKAFGSNNFKLSLVFFFLGLAAIGAAVKYTVGKSAYGYRGLGDVFVFVFFGLVSVLGSYFLYTQNLTMLHVLPAITIGVLSVAVLHLNNMRDRLTDQKVGKRTLAVILGATRSKYYHYGLLILGSIAWIGYLQLTEAKLYYYSSLIVFIPLVFHLQKVIRTKEPAALDPELKKVALTTFALALIFILIAFN